MRRRVIHFSNENKWGQVPRSSFDEREALGQVGETTHRKHVGADRWLQEVRLRVRGVPNLGSENFDKVVEKARKHNWRDEPDECPSTRTKEEGDKGVEQVSQDSKAEAMSIHEVWVIEIPLPLTWSRFLR